MGFSQYLKKNSKESSMRLVLLICCFTACLIALSSSVFYFILALKGKTLIDLASISLLVGTILGFAVGGKVGQSYSEVKETKQEKE